MRHNENGGEDRTTGPAPEFDQQHPDRSPAPAAAAVGRDPRVRWLVQRTAPTMFVAAGIGAVRWRWVLRRRDAFAWSDREAADAVAREVGGVVVEVTP